MLRRRPTAPPPALQGKGKAAQAGRGDARQAGRREGGLSMALDLGLDQIQGQLEKFAKLPRAYRMAAIPLIAMLVLGGYGWFFYQPASVERAAAEAKERDLERKVSEVRAIVANLAAFEQEIAELETAPQAGAAPAARLEGAPGSAHRRDRASARTRASSSRRSVRATRSPRTSTPRSRSRSSSAATITTSRASSTRSRSCLAS